MSVTPDRWTPEPWSTRAGATPRSARFWERWVVQTRAGRKTDRARLALVEFQAGTRDPASKVHCLIWSGEAGSPPEHFWTTDLEQGKAIVDTWLLDHGWTLPDSLSGDPSRDQWVELRVQLSKLAVELDQYRSERDLV